MKTSSDRSIEICYCISRDCINLIQTGFLDDSSKFSLILI